MGKEEFKDFDKISSHWLETSNEDFETMKKLFDSKTYHWSLFLGHISVEKLLKAYFVKKFRYHAPFTHNLYRQAELSKLEMDEEFSDWLDEITSFNLAARYDDYKKEFYKSCNQQFAKDWIEKNNYFKGMDKSKIITKVQEFALKVSETHNGAKFFLFGSFAKGTQKVDSDIDIAVVLKDFPSSREMQVELMKIRRNIDSRIEPHPFREKEFVKSNPLANEVLNHGLEIKFDLVS